MSPVDIELELVRHGKWQLMNDTYDRWKDYTCSECNCCVSYKYNYCPDCGAKMDGGK